MTIIFAVALIILGLAIGFAAAWIAWTYGISAGLTLFIGVLLVVAGAIIGFVTEWLIDEAYRKNRELRRELGDRSSTSVALVAGTAGPGDDTSSGTLSEILRQRDEEIRQLREQVSAADARLDGLEDEFDAYQRTHPDDLTVIKGIGAVYQWKLRDAGFNTYKQLAEANPEQLARMLDVKNWQRVNIEAWIEQARDWAQRG